MSRRVNGEGWISRKARSDGLWVARYTVVEDGRTRRPALYGQTRTEVAKKLREALAARDSDRRARAPVRQTVGEFLITWHEGTRSQLRATSWDRQGRAIRLHLVPALGSRSLVRLQPEDVQRTYTALLARGLAPASVRRVHAVLHRALGQAVRWRLLTTNVASLVDAPRIPHREMAALSPQQVRQLLRAAVGDRLEALWVLAVTSGMRRGELLALRWKDVDLDGGWLSVNASLSSVPDDDGHWRRVVQEPKTARSRRRVDLSAAAIAALTKHRAAQREERVVDLGGLVFVGVTGTYLDFSTVQNAFRDVLDRAELPRIRFHDLRHTAATLMLGSGVHPKIAADMLGHSTIAMTLDLYSHVTPSMQRDAVAALDAILG